MNFTKWISSIGKWTLQVLMTPNISNEQWLKSSFFAQEFTKSTTASPHSIRLILGLSNNVSSQTHQGRLSVHPPLKKQRIHHASLIIDTSNCLQLMLPGAQSSPWFSPRSTPGGVTLVLNELPPWHSLKKDYVVLIATYNMQGICHLNESIKGKNVW